MRSPRALLAMMSLLLLVPQQGFAATRESRERAARKACLKGDPEKGVGILTDLFVDTEDLTYIFNQGRCFEQNRRYDEAIGRFREYLIKGRDLSNEDRADAERHIAACQSYLGKTEPREAPVSRVPTAAPQPEIVPQPVPVASPTSADVASAVREAPEDHPGRGLRIAGITVGAVGAAALIGGLVLNLKVNSMSSDLAKPDNYSRATDSTRQDYKTLGWASYGVGAAGTVTGVVLYYLGSSKNQSPAPGIAFVPTIESSMAGASLKGAF